MNEFAKSSIATAARYCELELSLADTYERNAQPDQAEYHRERARQESDFAFTWVPQSC